MNPKPTVLLYGMEGIGLIIPCPSGVIFQNQTGGFSCLHDEMQGVFVPLDGGHVDHYVELHRFFYEGKWGGGCSSGIDEETAVFIDATLARVPLYAGIKTDRSRLRDSREAWVHVTVEDPKATLLLEGFGPFHGILTWPNSD